MNFPISNKSGVAIPLGAIRTEKSPVIGEFTALPRFAEFCKNSGLSIIQLLPILDTGTHSSPYSSLSAFALHPIYITLEDITNFGTCYEKDPAFRKEYDTFLKMKNNDRFDYAAVQKLKDSMLKKLFDSIINTGCNDGIDWKSQCMEFIDKNSWVKDYCVFKNLKEEYNQSGWINWRQEDKKLSKEDIEERWNRKELMFKHIFYGWEQFVAYHQLERSCKKVHETGIMLKCDLPILLNEDSCDVWAYQDLFDTTMHAGSIPDGDNPTGQNWGFPIYKWENHEKDNFAWWKLRLSLVENFFDAYRLDHIPGFFRLWATPDGEKTTEMGHSVPTSTISRETLSEMGFSTERIHWLSEPHIPTEAFFRLTGSLDKSHDILSLVCDRLGHEELWNFKPSIKSPKEFENINLSNMDFDEYIQQDIKNLLDKWWKNRTLLEIKKDRFVPMFKYGETNAWNTLDNNEKQQLSELFAENSAKEERLWQEQARRIFSELIPSSKMVPCGEDLGIFISCMKEVLDSYEILGIAVIRWCRDWFREGQPYHSLENFSKRCVVTTSVHDSPTLRQWWNSERDSVRAFVGAFLKEKERDENTGAELCDNEFSPEIANLVMSVCAKTSGAWFINPLQDWLYLDKKYYAANPNDERINIPGTVTDFNWTWRMPVPVEKLMENKHLAEKIKQIVQIHDEQEIQ